MLGVNSFDPERNVSVMRLLDLVEWAKQSEDWMLNPNNKKPDHGVLALPPLQRSAVWNPKQIVDLWDFVLRGLPIGSIYLLKRKGSGAAKGIVLMQGIQIKPARDGIYSTASNGCAPYCLAFAAHAWSRALLINAVSGWMCCEMGPSRGFVSPRRVTPFWV